MSKELTPREGDIIFYTTPDGAVHIEVMSDTLSSTSRPHAMLSYGEKDIIMEIIDEGA